jgi:hypothetical protein
MVREMIAIQSDICEMPYLGKLVNEMISFKMLAENFCG